MKTLIVPTDFSPASDNATNYAAQLAQQINAELLLTHIYQIPVSMNDMPVILISADELKKSADENLDRAKEELLLKYPDLPVKTESRLGDVNTELDDLCRQVQPFAIVLGSQGVTGIERILFGSTTLSIMHHTHYPVLAVPGNYTHFRLQKIVLASDLQPVETVSANKILEVSQELRAKLHIVHVTSNAEDAGALNNLQQQLHSINPTYETIIHDHVREGLETYLENEQADLLLVLPHEHNLMERLFFKLHADDLVSHATIPVMSIRC